MSQRARTTLKMVKQPREMKKKKIFFYAPVPKNRTTGRNPEKYACFSELSDPMA